MASRRRVIAGFSTDRITTEELQHKLVSELMADTYTPPKLPSVAIQLMALARKPEASLSEVVALLQHDQLLTGQVMKQANAAAVRGTSEIVSLRDAVVRLGISNLRDLVMRVAMEMRVFRSQGYSEVMNALRQHSIATAYVARVLADGSEWAFLSGLLHDVGIAGCLLVLGDTPRQSDRPEVAAVWPAIEAVHARASERMAQLWGIPEMVVEAIGHHHYTAKAPGSSKTAAIVCLADFIASECGYRVRPEGHQSALRTRHRVDFTSPESLATSREVLAMNDATYRIVLARMASELPDVVEGRSEPT